MRLILADTVHGVLVEGDFVLLDVVADTYFCLPAGAQTVRLTGRQLDVRPASLGQALCDAGLAVASDAASGTATAITSGSSGILRPRQTARAVLDAQPHLATAKTRVDHILALAKAIQAALAARPKAFVDRLSPGDNPPSLLTSELLSDLAVYRRLSPWLPIDGRCLFRSEMLRAYLRALGHEATWVFGVRTWPFRAHCWLQVEDVALDDEAERLAAYHPILAV